MRCGGALLAHDEVLRTAIEAHDGFFFSHTGDGVVAAFASPMSAVDAAAAAQRELDLPVRMGLATGEAELRDGDYFGTVLNRAHEWPPSTAARFWGPTRRRVCSAELVWWVWGRDGYDIQCRFR